MGNCCGTKHQQYGDYVQEDTQVEPGADVYNPGVSSLFNTLRKITDVVVIEPEAKGSPMLPNTMEIDFEHGKHTYIKTLLNFKKIVLIGHYQTLKTTIIRAIKQIANPKRIYIISESYCELFLQEFPIFRSRNWSENIVTSDIPILTIDTRDFNNCSSKDRVFIHSCDKANKQRYEQIGVKSPEGIIKQSETQQMTKAMSYYLKQLQNKSKDKVVVLHTPKLDPQVLAQVLVSYIKDEYKIPSHFAKMYLSNSLPKTNLHMERIQNNLQENNQQISSLPEENPSITQYKKLFQKLSDQAGVQKTIRAYELLNTLTANIYNHKDNDSMYRKVRRTTRQIVELSKYKAFQQLMENLGWKADPEFWKNQTDTKYLKIFKTDLDLAFRHFQDKK